MKLKVIFIIFNVLIVLSFALVFLLPALLLGWDYAEVFWRSNWYLALIFVAVIALLNIYFARNYPLFSALEREDWDGVISVLEQRVYRGRRRRGGSIRLLINAYVVTSQPERIERLEAHLREHDYAALTAHATLFGIPHLLSNDGARMERYYAEFRTSAKGDERRWIEWCYAFAQMLQSRVEPAREALTGLLGRPRPDILSGLTVYLLDSLANADPTLRATVEEERSRIASALPRHKWRAMVERSKSDLQLLILTRLVRDVEAWLYDAGTDRPEVPES